MTKIGSAIKIHIEFRRLVWIPKAVIFLEKTQLEGNHFADPYSAWQRGTNENMNKLLRQYFPKGMDLRAFTDQELASKVKMLNHRPRKCLNYQTPHEVYRQAWPGALAT
jgi:IS30 family transposase